ncbi:MAG: radical SAM protein [Bacillota bacterium]|jgi:radical SAM protein with 4Fe4S-binding SPASM domain
MEVDLHITNNCNLRCQHCVYTSGERYMPTLSYSTVRSLTDEFRKLNVNEVHITGGEPLLNPELLSIIQFLTRDGFRVKMQSNGLLINEEKAVELKRAGLKEILISLDGLEESHDNLRAYSGSFKSAVSAIRYCLDAEIPVRVNTVVSRRNCNEIAPLIAYLQRLGVVQHSFFYLTPIGRAEALIDSALSFREWKRVEELIIGEAGNLNMLHRIKVQSVFQEKPPLGLVQSCRADNCLILSNGDVYHCVLFSNSQDCRLGNVFSTPLSDIWQTLPDRLSTIVQQRISACSNDCWGGCPGMTYLLRGRVNTCDPRCEPHFGLYSSCIRQYHKFGEKEHDKEA